MKKVTALALCLSACATGPQPVPPGSPAASSGSSAGATPAVTAPPPREGGATVPAASSAVEGLLREARRYRETGDLAASFARLERALRIAPRHAQVYLELARSHRAAGDPVRAAASAERGLLYCGGSTCRALQQLIDS